MKEIYENSIDALKLNLGCGPVQPKGWINIDGSNRAWLASRLSFLDNILVKLNLIPPTEFNNSTKYANLFKKLPYADNSVSVIYSGELWEHFEFDDANALTHECYRVLKPSGVLRVCVPDGPLFWRNYLKIFDDMMKLPCAQRKGKPLRDYVQMYFNDICTRKYFLRSMGHFHKWQFDEVQLIEMFESNNFSKVERMKFQQSRIADIECVERADFIIIEGVKGFADSK